MPRKFTLCRIADCGRINNAKDGLCKYHYEERRGKEAYAQPLRSKYYGIKPKPEKLAP